MYETFIRQSYLSLVYQRFIVSSLVVVSYRDRQSILCQISDQYRLDMYERFMVSIHCGQIFTRYIYQIFISNKQTCPAAYLVRYLLDIYYTTVRYLLDIYQIFISNKQTCPAAYSGGASMPAASPCCSIISLYLHFFFDVPYKVIYTERYIIFCWTRMSRVQGLGFRVQGLGQGLGFRVQGLGVQVFDTYVQGLGFRFQGLGFRCLGV